MTNFWTISQNIEMGLRIVIISVRIRKSNIKFTKVQLKRKDLSAGLQNQQLHVSTWDFRNVN